MIARMPSRLASEVPVRPLEVSFNFFPHDFFAQRLSRPFVLCTLPTASTVSYDFGEFLRANDYSRLLQARIAIKGSGSPDVGISQRLGQLLVICLVVVRPGGQSAVTRRRHLRQSQPIQPEAGHFQDVDAFLPACCADK